MRSISFFGFISRQATHMRMGIFLAFTAHLALSYSSAPSAGTGSALSSSGTSASAARSASIFAAALSLLTSIFQPVSPRGKARVLPVPADRKRELVIGHDGDRRLIPHFRNGDDFCGRERLCDKFQRVFAPLDDVHFFAAQLRDDGVDARALVAHARADGVHLRVKARDRHFRALPRLAGDLLDDDHARLDLGHFLFKQALYKPRRRAGDEHLRAAAARLDVLDVHFEAVVHLVALAGDLVPAGA